MQGRLSSWLVKHGLIHRSLGFDYLGIETLQIKPEDWHSIAVILYVYGYNYLRSQCAYDVAPGGLLASVYHFTRIEYGINQPEEEKQKMQGRLSSWLVKHGLIHRSLGFDYLGVETLQIKPEDWHSIAVILYVYGYNYLRSQCAYDVAPGGLLASVYHLTRIEYGINQPEEVCIKIFVSRKNPRIPSIFWVWKSADFQEQESYDMLGISYDSHPRLRRILMPENWIGWPLRKDYIAPNFYEIQDAH
ncbi:hypothetical protein PIB30_064933 [Stylosanthes scabra]|nr:hypothetical protein [Stylosanthes scabra]